MTKLSDRIFKKWESQGGDAECNPWPHGDYNVSKKDLLNLIDIAFIESSIGALEQAKLIINKEWLPTAAIARIDVLITEMKSLL